MLQRRTETNSNVEVVPEEARASTGPTLMSLDLNDFPMPETTRPQIQGGLRQRLVASPCPESSEANDEAIQTEMVDIAQRLKQTTKSINQQLKSEESCKLFSQVDSD